MNQKPDRTKSGIPHQESSPVDPVASERDTCTSSKASKTCSPERPSSFEAVESGEGLTNLLRRDNPDMQQMQAMAFRQLAETNLFGVGFGDTRGNVTYLNDEMLRMMGRSREDFDSQKINWIACLAPECRSEHVQVWSECLHKDGQTIQYEREFIRPDGTRTPFLGATAVVDSDSDSHVSIALDMTHIKADEERMERANQELEKRIGNRTAQLRALASRLIETEDAERQRLSEFLHDSLQQQLAVIKLRLNRIVPKEQRSTTIDQRIGETICLIDEAIAHTRQLSRELSPLNLRMHGLFKALENLAEEMRNRYGLQVELDLDKQAEPKKESIASIMLRASREMLYNVVKHSGIFNATLRAYRQNKDIIFEVRDKGRGVDMEKLSRKRKSGQCLGLLSIEERIQDLGGKLWLHSEPGKGCCVKVTLPTKLGYASGSGNLHAKEPQSFGKNTSAPLTQLSLKDSINL